MGAMKRLLDKVVNGDELTPDERTIVEGAEKSDFYIDLVSHMILAQAQVGVEEVNHE